MDVLLVSRLKLSILALNFIIYTKFILKSFVFNLLYGIDNITLFQVIFSIKNRIIDARSTKGQHKDQQKVHPKGQI